MRKYGDQIRRGNFGTVRRNGFGAVLHKGLPESHSRFGKIRCGWFERIWHDKTWQVQHGWFRQILHDGL